VIISQIGQSDQSFNTVGAALNKYAEACESGDHTREFIAQTLR
jgi:hypothetical protein